MTTLRRRLARLISNDADYDGTAPLRKKELKYIAVALAGNHHHLDEDSVTAASTRPREDARAGDQSTGESQQVEVHESTRPGPYSDNEVLDLLRDLAGDLGRPPTVTDINDADGPSATVYYNRFEDIFKAREAAGVGHPDSYHRLQEISIDEALAEDS